MNAPATLLALLDHADASTLLVLMLPPNLAALLRHYGAPDAQIGAALDEQSPGELLLGLFAQGRKADELLAVLGPEAALAVAAERAKKSASTTTQHAPMPSSSHVQLTSVPRENAVPSPRHAWRDRSHQQMAGFLLIVVAGVTPGMLYFLDHRFASYLFGSGLGLVLGSVALLGAVGGALIAGERTRWRAAASGALTAVGGLVSVVAYLRWGPGAHRISVMNVEIAFVLLLGMLPGLFLYVWLSKLGRK